MGSVPALRFPEFRGEWREVKLESLVIIERGASPRPINQYITEDESGVNWIKIGDIAPNSKYITQTAEKITQVGAKKSRAVKPNDFVLSNSMSFGRPYISKIYGCIHDGWLLMRNKQEKQLLNSFLFEIMSTNIVKKQLLSMAAGSAVKNLKSENVKKVKISLPNLPEQQKIADFLTAVDGKIAILTDKITRLEAYKKGMMQKLLSGELRFPGFTDAWREVKLGEVATFSKGKGISKNDISNDGQCECIRYGELFTIYKESITRIYSRTNKCQKMKVSKGNEVLMPTSDVTPQGLATASAIQKPNIVIGGDILIITSLYLINTYLAYLIRSNKPQIMRLVSGVTVYHIYADDMKTFRLKLPSLPEQQKIADFLTAIDDKLTLEKERLEALKRYKQGLLQKMFV